ncbi:AAA family ATPase [Nocardia terpenica]|uniref:AAA family ATPase n=1 Tax=Nocardia terpenica TaxID=455432 RepID=UPI001E3D23AF|nr:AAA family ATPase [Nocardia terpenica]
MTSSVPQLVHLNGPPGIGKSTIAEMYASRHPGTLRLDIDYLHRLVGGWQDRETQTHRLLRPVALAMATSHLRGGHDVLLPQCLATIHEINEFEEAARRANAKFREVVLLDSQQSAIERFERRTKENDDEWIQHSARVIELEGGPLFLAGIYDKLLAVLEERPSAVVLTNMWGDPEGTYERLVASLNYRMA